MLFSVIRLLAAMPFFYSSAFPHPLVRIVNSATGLPVPYGSVGVKNKPIGTVADSDGRFSIATLAAAAATDTVTISCVGFQSRKLILAELSSQSTINLMPQNQILNEVVVSSKGWKRHRIGHNGVSVFTSLTFYTQTDTVPHARLGRELGPLLRIRQPVRLESFHFFTSGRDFQLVTFRLNIYAVRNGQPQQSLLQHDVIFTVPGQRRGWNEIDLRPYAIDLAGPQEVAATVQWLSSVEGRPNSRFLDIPAHLSVLHTTFRRDKSGQTWQKTAANPSFYFTTLSLPE